MNARLWIRCFGCTAFTAGVFLGLQVASFAGVYECDFSSSEAERLTMSSALELHLSINEAVELSSYAPPRQGEGSGAPREGHGSGTR